MSDVLYTFIVAVWFAWSDACVITFPVIAGCLFCILTMYSFSSPAPFFTVTVTSVMFSFKLIFFWFDGESYDVSPFVSFIFTPLIYHFFNLRYELFFIGNIINTFWCKILLANPSKAYSATTESLSVQRIIPVGLLDSSSFTIC